MNIFLKTFDEMPKHFTSFQFTRRLIHNGFPEHKIKNNGVGKFLHVYAENEYFRSKTWTKRTSVSIPRNELKLNDVKEQSSTEMTDEQMIQHLKSKGYKIMKPIKEWIEL